MIFVRWLYTKSYILKVYVLRGQFLTKKLSVPWGNFSKYFMKMFVFSQLYRSKWATLEIAYGLIRWRTRKFRTVMLIEMPRFSVAKLLLHHYKSDLAHTSDRCSSVIELYLSEIREKNNWKTNDSSSVATKFAHFLVISVRNVWSKST